MRRGGFLASRHVPHDTRAELAARHARELDVALGRLAIPRASVTVRSRILAAARHAAENVLRYSEDPAARATAQGVLDAAEGTS